jgi:DNA (cytosine-5)-methyltransferase 1
MSKRKKYKVIDLFSGAGGFGLGFKMAGYDLCLSLEIDQWATDTLSENNRNGMIILKDDIRNYENKKAILNACKNTPDVVIGGPPCQGFSNAGSFKRKPNDPRNSLFKDFAKWVEYLQPTIFIMENVKGILSRCDSKGKRIIELIKNTFSEIGYSNLNIWTLNAAEYGVPQLRERVFIVGHKKNIAIEPPQKTHYINKRVKGLEKAISIKEAISDLPKINASEGQEILEYKAKPKSDYQIWARGNQEYLYNHIAMKHTKRIIERFSHIDIGESVFDVPLKHKERKRNGNGEISEQSYNMNNRRLEPNKPSCTIPASFYSCFIHPYLNRNITAREAARLQSFPDNYRFMGKRTLISSKLLKRNGAPHYNYLSQYNQIGNAVPPLLSKAIAEHIYSFL